jgi:hypothetical protein
MSLDPSKMSTNTESPLRHLVQVPEIMKVVLTNPTPSYLIGGNQWDAPYALFLKTVFLLIPCSFTRSMVCED